MIKCLLSIHFLIFIIHGIALCQDDNDRKHMAFNLSNTDVEYIYNRAFDIALRDNRSGLEARSMFYWPVEDIDSMYITIDPDLSSKAFDTRYIDSLNWIRFEDSLNLENQFNEVKLSNTFNIKHQHYDTTPLLIRHHQAHVTFSGVYVYQGYLYVGVMLEYKVETGGLLNFSEWVLFKIEICKDDIIYFRKMYYPLGTDGYRNISYTRDLEDRKCY